MEGRLMHHVIIGSCQSAATSKIVKALLVTSPTHVSSTVASTRPLPLDSYGLFCIHRVRVMANVYLQWLQRYWARRSARTISTDRSHVRFQTLFFCSLLYTMCRASCCFTAVACYFLRQVHGVNGGDTVFVWCVSVCVCVCVCVQWTGQSDQFETVRVQTSNLTCMFPGTVRTWPLKNFLLQRVWLESCTPIFWGVKY